MGSMKHLQNLVWLNAHTNRLEHIEWECLPESLPSIIFWNNCLTNVGSIKHLKNLYELNLNENQISSILWEDFPATLLKEIDLSYNFLTGIGSMAHLKNIKTLKLKHNRISSIQWEFFPPNLKDLNLSHNHISVLYGSTKFLPKLENLYLAFNHLKEISVEILTFSNLGTLNLSNNSITEITPAALNLHNFMLDELDLSNNKFNNATENLIEKLWNNLPICEWLILGGNNLVELPCVLEGKFKNLNAVNCNLEYICPKLANYIININIGNNPKLLFPFHPRHLLPCKYPKDNYEFDNKKERPYIIGDFKVSSNTKKFKNKRNKFLPVSSEIDQSKFSCKCCTTCIKKDASIIMVENDMVMDFLFLDYQTVENEENEADMENRVYFDWDVFNRDRNTIKLPSQWKTTVRTRVCEECQNFTTMLIEGVNSKKLDISNEENNPAKKIRIEQPMESVTEKNSTFSGENSAMDNDMIDFESFAFPQQQCSLPAQTYYYEEPHGCSSISAPLTNSIPFPQQQQQQPHEQYYYDDLINPVGYQNDFSYQIPTNSQAGYGSMIEKNVFQDSFGNHLMTAPAGSIISQQNNQICQIPQTFDNLQNGNNHLTFTSSTNILPPQQQHHYFVHNEMPQFVDHQQKQWRHNSTNFEHMQNINHLHDDINTYIEPHFLYHPENHESQQSSSYNYTNFSDYQNSSQFLDDINKL